MVQKKGMDRNEAHANLFIKQHYKPNAEASKGREGKYESKRNAPVKGPVAN